MPDSDRYATSCPCHCHMNAVWSAGERSVHYSGVVYWIDDDELPGCHPECLAARPFCGRCFRSVDSTPHRIDNDVLSCADAIWYAAAGYAQHPLDM